MLLNTVELRILELLSQGEIRGTATLGDEALPPKRTSRTRQGAALAVGRFTRSLSAKGLIVGRSKAGDVLTTYRITEKGRDALLEASEALASAGLHQPTESE